MTGEVILWVTPWGGGRRLGITELHCEVSRAGYRIWIWSSGGM